MPTKNRGNPQLTVRLTRDQHTALKILSKRTGQPVGVLVREQIESLLYINGLTPESVTPPIVGQISTKDLFDA